MKRNSVRQSLGGRLFVAEKTSKHEAASLAVKPEGLATLGRELEVQIEKFAENVFTCLRVFQASYVDIDVYAIENILAEDDTDFFTLDEGAGFAKRLDVFHVQQEAEVAAKLGILRVSMGYGQRLDFASMHSCAVLGNEPPAVGSIACRIPGLRVKPAMTAMGAVIPALCGARSSRHRCCSLRGGLVLLPWLAIAGSPLRHHATMGKPLSHVQARRATAKEILMVLDLVLTCPVCGHAKAERMPLDACQWFYKCENCATLLCPSRGLLRVLLVWHAMLPADAGERGGCVLPACQHSERMRRITRRRPSSCTQ